MKEHFVLDENTLILAHMMRDEHERPDDTCLSLIKAIIERCHSFVLCQEIEGKYGRQLKTLQRQRIPLIPGLMKIIKLSLYTKEKDTQYVSDGELALVDRLEELTGVDVGDRIFVRAAASVAGAILVTTDSKLSAALRAANVDDRYGFRLLTPRDALRLIEQD